MDTINEEVKIEDILKNRKVSPEKLAIYVEAMDVSKHPVNMRQPTSIYSIEEDKDGNPTQVYSGQQKANIIPDSLINEIVETAVVFAAGNKPKITYNTTNNKKVEKIKEILNANKELSLNSSICRSLFAFSEVAELWTIEKGTLEVKSHVLSPMFGDTLYPEIDRFGNMQSFAYSNWYEDEDGERITELTHFTKDKITIYRGSDDELAKVEEKENIFDKLPVIYSNQGKSDYEDVIKPIYRMEETASNIGASADMVAFPDKVIEGKIEGIAASPGESAMYMMQQGAKMYYVESQGNNPMLDNDYNRMESIARNRTSTPDLSPEALKGLGAASGVMYERLMTQAILKAKGKIDSYLTEFHLRRLSVLNHIIVAIGNYGSLDDIMFNVEIEPYVPMTNEDKIDRLRKLIGLMPIEYIVKKFKEEIDNSIDEEEILGWLRSKDLNNEIDPMF